MSFGMDTSTFLGLLGGSSVRAALLVMTVFIALLVTRSLSAQARHSVWFAVILACVAFPLLTLVLPSLLLPILPASPLETMASQTPRIHLASSGPTVDTASGIGLGDMMMAVYFIGALSVMTSFLRALRRIARLEKNMVSVSNQKILELKDELCRSTGIRRSISLLTTHRIDTPMTWGVLHPRIALPSYALMWPQPLLRNALLHELYHVRRVDWVRLWVMRTATALYWFNPFFWMAIRHCTFEAERACDDFVLSCGGRSSDYAAQLVEIMTNRRDVTISGASIALGDKDLAKRVRAILESSKKKENSMKKHQVLPLTTGVFTAAALLAACQVSTAQDVGDNPNILAESQLAESPPLVTPSPKALDFASLADAGLVERLRILEPMLEELGPALEGLEPALQGLGPALEGLEPMLQALGPSLEGLEPALQELGPALEGLEPALQGLLPVLQELVSESREQKN